MKIKKSKKNILHFTLSFCVLVLMFSIPTTADASRLYFETVVVEVGVGQEMEVTLRVDSEGETINALEGVIHMPSILSTKEVRDGDTLIALWGERPQINADGAIIFGGIIPGGWKGTDGKIFSFIAKTEKEGSDAVVVSDAKVLLHDGHGSETQVIAEPLMLYVDESNLVTPLTFDYDDDEAPESFKLLLAQDPDIFGGDHFLVFIAQDKGSGVDHYEVQESKKVLKDEQDGEWQTIESPYRIADQALKSFVYIRAIDRADNTRVSLFEPTEITKRGVSGIVYKILIIILIFIIILIYKRRRRRKRFNRYRKY